MKKLIFILIALVSFSQAQTIQTIGSPTTTVVSRGNFRTDSIFYLPKRTKAPTDTAAFRYQISDSSLYYWTGYQWTKVQSASSFASVDTNIISTRAWRQKGDDSLLYLITQNIVGGGAAISYYLNHGVVSSVSGYKQMSKSPVTSVGADTSKSGNGLIAQFLTDVSDPSRLEIPAGNWNLEIWFSSSSNGGNEKFYVELLKYNGSTFTSIASSSANPEAITNGTSIDLYLTSLAIPQTTLALTDRLAFRVYIVDNSGARTITLHTQNSHLCQIITNFSSGMTALNGLTQSVQFFATGTSGTDFNISSATDTHTFNLPTASSSNRGALSSSDWTTFNNKVNISDTSTMLSPYLLGSGTSNYFPKFNATRSVVNSKLYESNLNLIFNSTTPYITTSGISSIENNGTSAALYVLKTLDTARAYVSFGGANTMDINNLRAGDIRFYTNATLRGRFQTDGTFRLNSLTGTGSRIVVADDNGVLSASSSATGLVDTTVLSTRAYKQKGDDSLGAIIATKGSGTVTSVATGYGLSGGTITTTGTLIADTALIASRLRLGKVADSLSLVKQNVLTNPVTGTGTTNYVPKFTGTSTIGNSSLYNTTAGSLGINQPFVTEYTRKTTIEAANESGAAIRLRTYGTTGVFEINTDSTNTIIKTMSNSALLFGVNNLEAGRIFNNGRYYIGASPADNGYLLDVNGTLRNTGAAYFATSSGNVGIGNTSPSFKLQVNSSDYQVANFQSSLIAAGANYSSIVIGQIAANSSAVIGYARDTNNAANSFFYVTPYGSADGSQFRMSASGNVGIGFSNNTTYKLDINGTLRSVNGANFATTSGEVIIGSTTDAGAYTLQNNGALYNTGSAILAATSGGVTMGSTATSLSELDIYGTTSLAFTGFRAQQLIYSTEAFNTTPNASIGFVNKFTSGGGYGTLGSISVGKENTTDGNASGYMSLYTYGPSALTEKMRINSSGETLFGTTTDAGNYRVQVSGNAYVSDRLSVATTSTNASIVSYNATNSIFSLLTNGEIYNREVGSSAANNAVEVHIRPYAGKSGYLTFTENAVADRWAIGIQNANSGLRFLANGALGTETIKFHTTGGIRYVPQSAAPTAEAGTVYYDSDDNKLKVYNGTTWVDLH